MLRSKHPAWEAQDANWTQLIDCYEGEQAIKAKGVTYLPATAGMEIDGMEPGSPGYAAYSIYKNRAVFPNDVMEAVNGLVGLLHRKPPQIEVPEALAPLLEKITPDGADAETLLRRINAAQILTGRCGLLLDVADGAPAGTLPYVAMYGAHSATNWDTRADAEGMEQLAVLVLNETGMVMQPSLEWEEVEEYRVLVLDSWLAEITGQTPPATPSYMVGVKQGDGEIAAVEFKPVSLAGATLGFIPFTFVNAMDLAFAPDVPPMLGLSNTCLSIYRGEADYRHSLYMQGQETLVIIGALDTEPDSATERRIGAGAVLDLPTGGDAKYVGVSSAGLSEQREALKADYEKAANQGLKLLDLADGGSAESGDALRIRVAARTASITGIARAGAAGLQNVLRQAALWIGANPDEVIVTPNLDFVDEGMDGKSLLDWVSAKNQGAPISWKTIHDMLVAREVTQMTFEEEQDEISTEQPVGMVDPVTGESIDPNAPPVEEEEDPDAEPSE